MKIENTRVLQACLNLIRDELDRQYWNKHQKDMDSPFDNTGCNYKNDVFSVYAYNWYDENYIPNFTYKDLGVWWYKNSNRGLYAECSHPLSLEFLEQMIHDCCESIKYDNKL